MLSAAAEFVPVRPTCGAIGTSLYSSAPGTPGVAEARTGVYILGTLSSARPLSTNSMSARGTKFRASISKSHIAVDGIGGHFDEQRTALQSMYDCAMVLTETGDRYTLHVQRDNGKKMAVNMIQQALNDKYGPPEKYTRRTGVVVIASGKIRGHGGARRGVTSATGGGNGGGGNNGKKSGRYDEVKLSAIGDEECTLDTISLEELAAALSRGSFFETIKCFGFYLQHVTIGNHNFVCSPKERLAKYVPNGAPYFIAESKKTVCREVCNNWVKKITEMIDNNQGQLDEEAVTNFRQQKQEYLELVPVDSREVSVREKQVVEAVSETAKHMRTMHEQDCGKKVKLVV